MRGRVSLCKDSLRLLDLISSRLNSWSNTSLVDESIARKSGAVKLDDDSNAWASPETSVLAKWLGCEIS